MPKFDGYMQYGKFPGPYATDVLDQVQGPISQPQVVLDEIEREKKRAMLRDSLKKKRANKISPVPDAPVPTTSEPGRFSDLEKYVDDMNLYPRPYSDEPTVPLRYDEKKPEEQIDTIAPSLRNAKPEEKQPPQFDQNSSKQMLYDYLENRRKSEPIFQDRYRDLSDDAETGRVLTTFASGLGEMASMAGTVGGKRADTGDLKALPNAIYGAQRREADEMLALRRLANQEQVSDIRLLRDLERGDLDALRTQKILADLQRDKQVPKTLPYFVPGDGKNPPQMVMMRADGTIEYRPLPQGAISTAGGVTLGQPITVGNKTMYPRVNSKTGQVDYFEAPEGAKTEKQTQLESQEKYRKDEQELKRLQNEITNANAAQKLDIERRMYELKKSMDEYNKSKGDRQEDRKDKELEIKKIKAATGAQKQTEFEKKSALQGSVALKALEQVKAMENGDPQRGLKPYRPGKRSTLGQMAGGTSGIIGNRILSDEDRLYDTAANQLTEMLLRNVTGASAQKEEIRRTMAGYKVLPGDDEKTIKFKQKTRDNYVDGILKSAQKGGNALDTTKSVRKPLSEMTREEKLRELEEHQAGGR